MRVWTRHLRDYVTLQQQSYVNVTAAHKSVISGCESQRNVNSCLWRLFQAPIHHLGTQLCYIRACFTHCMQPN